MCLPAIWDAGLFFRFTPQRAAVTSFGANPFLEAIPAGALLAREQFSRRHDRRLGSEPEDLFLLARRSATGYIYVYGLMEIAGLRTQMQDEMIREIETDDPSYLVYVTSPRHGSRSANPTRTSHVGQALSRQGYQLISLPETAGNFPLSPEESVR